MRMTVWSLLIACLTIFCYMTSAGTAAEDAEMVMYLTFDDDGAPEDESPKKSAIASHTKPAGLVEGVEGNAWVFDDSTCILLDNPTFEAGFQESTFSVWLKEPGEDGIIYEEGGTTKGFATSLVKGEVQFATRDASVQTTVGSGYPDDNDWHFITAVFDNGTMRLYIDGELRANITTPPYTWIWKRAFFKHTIKVVAFDNEENTASDELVVCKFF